MSVDTWSTPPADAAVGLSVAGAWAPIAIVGVDSETWNPTPIASCGAPGASVMNTAL